MSPEMNISKIFDIVSAFHVVFAKENIKRHFLISSVLADNAALCSEQHFEQACSRSLLINHPITRNILARHLR